MNEYQVIIKLSSMDEPISVTLPANRVIMNNGVYMFIQDTRSQPIACFSVANIIGIINRSVLNSDNEPVEDVAQNE